MRPDRHWQARSKEYLQRIDEIDQQLKGTHTDQDRLALARERKEVCREFARLLRSVETDFDQIVYFSDDGRIVRASIHIDGPPPRKEKSRAAEWMKQRGLEWDGAGPKLRHAVRSAMEAGDDFPADMFGLFHEWTISITGPNEGFLELKAVSEALLEAFESQTEA
jgi:hypothetical protein